MQEQLFVRIRGHVQGPYELEKLRSLVRRGQLSRMHEVSADGSVWKQASSFPELFISPAVDGAQASREGTSASKFSDSDAIGLESPQAGATGRWHYAQNDVQKGPVTIDELKAIIASGDLDDSALVWTDGMKEWSPARTIPGLLTLSLQRNKSYDGTTDKLDREATRTLAESRPWTNFISFVMYFIGMLGIILGAAAIVMGARWNYAHVIAGGGFSILYGAVFFCGGQLLFRYCSDVAKVVNESSMRRLDTALRSLRRFWIFLSIILIVLIVNASAIAIWAFSIGVSLSGR